MFDAETFDWALSNADYIRFYWIYSTGQAGQVEMHSDWLDVTNLDGATTRNANQRAILMVPFLSRHEWLSAVEKRRMPWQFVHV